MIGPRNLVTFAKAVPEYWFMGELVGDPQNEEGSLKENPINYVDNIKPTTRLLVIQDANDPRVVKNEYDQIVKSLRSKLNIWFLKMKDTALLSIATL
jgi:dipeptidyl aminopeptidase/acylaminoacyl peptidase